VFGGLDVDGAVDVGMGQHAKHGLDDVAYFLVGQPLLFAQHFLAHQSFLDVGVVDGGSELELGEFERKLFGEVHIDGESEAFVGGAEGSIDEKFPMEEILLYVGCDASA
jgi:hypothetical protein